MESLTTDEPFLSMGDISKAKRCARSSSHVMKGRKSRCGWFVVTGCQEKATLRAQQHGSQKVSGGGMDGGARERRQALHEATGPVTRLFTFLCEARSSLSECLCSQMAPDIVQQKFRELHKRFLDGTEMIGVGPFCHQQEAWT